MKSSRPGNWLRAITLVLGSVLAVGLAGLTVTEMNATAREGNALDNRAATISGQDGPGQMTSAYDPALITRNAMAHPGFAELIGTPYSHVPRWGPHAGFGIAITSATPSIPPATDTSSADSSGTVGTSTTGMASSTNSGAGDPGDPAETGTGPAAEHRGDDVQFGWLGPTLALLIVAAVGALGAVFLVRRKPGGGRHSE